MRFKGLDLNLLIALHVLLEEHNVTRAAARMHVGQTAMSAALSRLRSHFDDELLIHSGRQMMPTALAETIRRPLREAIQHIEAVVDIDRGFVPIDSNRCFRMEMPEHLVPVLLPILTRLTFLHAPGISLDVRPSSGDPSPLLQRNELDLVVTPSIYSNPNFASEPLLTNALVLVGWSKNPALQKQPDLATVMSLQQIIVKFDRARLSSILTQEQLSLYGGGDRTALVAPNFSCIPSCLIGTSRISLLFNGLAKLATAELPIIIWKVPIPMPSMPEVMMFHPMRRKDAALGWLRGKLREAVAEAGL
ncbi:LysR family transcriptional regulator [Sphingomonas populi]|uniref:LysR family transcriptional regulator n=1 Tax=Sphingomonas populi TaxID=2484750 RepID=A0A4Q6XRU9_9SPHN|nr:LysR family transcriptional regulator [Sphingomonas populi]RZF59237.1 LysR family transcriptional regulator [Sphingomonas populi]